MKTEISLDNLFYMIYCEDNKLNNFSNESFFKKVFFSHDIGLNYPSTTFRVNSDDNILRIKTTTLGIVDQMGILPNHYLESLIYLKHANENALSDFFDLFLCKIIYLYYQSWKRNKLHLLNKQRRSANHYISITQALVGSNKCKADKEDVTYYQALYSHLYITKNKNKENLEILLNSILTTKVKVIENVGLWQALPIDLQTRIGSKTRSNNQLGINACIGKHFWNCQNNITIEIGPVNKKQYLSFLPDGQNHSMIHQLIRDYLPKHVNYEIHLTINKDDITSLKLNNSCKLGIDTWLETKPHHQHKNNMILGGRK
jgi:type VI secretion system protein ImpH